MNVDPVIKIEHSKVLELFNWLSDNTVGWDIEVNPHNINYEDRRSYFRFMHQREEPAPAYNDAWDEGAHFYEAIAYANTPVVHVVRLGSNLEEVLQLLKDDVIAYQAERPK